ncbi:MAG: hypothetical protein H3C35_05920 [Bacteroidetes bacterium]|nr:hypothetical protein [Bacteroidota bacterium]
MNQVVFSNDAIVIFIRIYAAAGLLLKYLIEKNGIFAFEKNITQRSTAADCFDEN